MAEAGEDGAQKHHNHLTMREIVCAQIRVLVKRMLPKYGYPPDRREKATWTIPEQAERYIDRQAPAPYRVGPNLVARRKEA